MKNTSEVFILIHFRDFRGNVTTGRTKTGMDKGQKGLRTLQYISNHPGGLLGRHHIEKKNVVTQWPSKSILYQVWVSHKMPTITIFGQNLFEAKNYHKFHIFHEIFFQCPLVILLFFFEAILHETY